MEILAFFLVCNAFIAIAIILAFKTIHEAIIYDGKRTRKETQEIKTRLTQMRKDLNIIDIKVTAREPMPKIKKNGK